METIQIIYKDNFAILQLDRGKSNPINHAMVKEIRAAIKSLETNENVHGVIIAGKERFFSAGLDLIELYSYNKEQFASFWSEFSDFVMDLTSFSKPLISAISGHSPAGGCVIAICCDYRVMVEGNYKIGLNEIPVGLLVPKGIMTLYSQWVGSKIAYQYLMEGKLFDGAHALSIGLVDELVSAEELLPKAELKLKQYMSFDQNAWRQTKKNLRSSLVKDLDFGSGDGFNLAMQQWWSTNCRDNIKSIIDGLQKK